MDLASYRKSRGVSQQQLADHLGIRSKAYVCALERKSKHPTVEMALKIQKWSEGAIRAEELLPPKRAAVVADAQPPGG